MKLSPVTGSSTPTHFVFCVDVSGSMHRSLSTIRAELKNKLASILKPSDLLTIIWFSGKNDAGYVFKHLSVANAKQLQEIHDGIDRWLQADCLTAFDKPIRLAGEAVKELRTSNIECSAHSFTFMSDGYNNDVSKEIVMKELAGIKDMFSAFNFIEYGSYCDSKFMAEMAQLVGATQTVSQSVDELMSEVENRLSAAVMARAEIAMPAKATHGFGFDGESLIVYPVVGGKCLVNADTTFLIGIKDGEFDPPSDLPIMNWLVLALGYAMLGNWKNTEECLSTIGDEQLLQTLGGAYGIQKIESFKQLLLSAIKGDIYLNPTTGAKIDENAFCVFDLLELLTSAGENFLLPDHDAFNYKRIGLQKKSKVSEEVQLAAKAADFFGITEAPVKPIEFEKIPNQEVALNKLTLNTERANVSLLATFKGTVINILTDEFGITEFDTVIHRNFTIIQDGRLNVTTLPVRLSTEFFNKLPLEAANKIFDGQVIDGINIIDLSRIPVINRSRIKSLNAKESVEIAFNLLKIRAALKVVKTLRPDTYNQVEGQSPEVAEFLKSIGITNKGFSPKVESVESVDFYYAPELTFSFAGASALPSIAKVIEKGEKIAQWAINPKWKEPVLNLGEALIAQALAFVDVLSPEKAIEYAAKINAQKRELERKLSGIVSTVILSRGWFADKTDFEDNKVTLDIPKLGQVDCTINFRDIQVKI